MLAPFAVGLALLSAFLTFVVLTGLTPIEPTRHVVISFLLINAATILLLVGIIVREVWQVVQARRRGRAAARLHVQIVSLFSVIAVLPAVLVAIVANVTIDRGLDRLFSGPTREVIQNSLIIARAYTHEHAQLIRGDILGMANDIAHARPLFDQDRGTFRELADGQCRRAQSAGRDADRQGPQYPGDGANRHSAGFRDAGAGIPAATSTRPSREIAVFPEANYVAAVIRLRAFNDTFLYVARLLDPHVVAQLKQTEASVAEYAELESRRLGIQVERRADVRGDRADHPDGLGADRAEFRQLAGGADPAADERRQYRSRPAICMSRCRCIDRKAISRSSARPSTR